LGILIVVTVLVSFTYALGNAWLMLTGQGYEIPEESSIFTFNATVMNNGSGEWWIYGEDGRNYYHYTGGSPRSYIALAKAQSTKCPAFDRHSITTWCS
jgi:hypothetical protein